MVRSRRIVAALAALAVGAGSFVVEARPQPVHATVPTPGIVTNFAGGSTSGYATSIFQSAWGLGWLGSNLVVADYGGSRIRSVDLTTGVESVLAGNGQIGPSGDGGPAAAAAIGYPRHLAVDGSGDIFFAADDRVREILANGSITTVAGGGAGCTEPCPATSAILSNAHGVAVDAAGDLFIADTYHHVIRKVTSGQITTIAGTFVAGFSGDTGPGNLAQLRFPEAVAADSSGNVFISDSANNRVREIDHTTGNINTIAGTGAVAGTCPTGPALTTPVWDPQGLSFDTSGNLLIAADFDQCVKKLSGGNLTDVASWNGVNWAPRMAVADASGNIYAADTPTGPNGGHVLKFTTPTTHSVVAGSMGSCQVYGINGPASSAMLCGPDGVTIAPNGEVFIADPAASEVVKVDAGGVLRLVAGTGTAGMLGDNGPATSAQLNMPASVAVDSSGNVYISDLMNDAVRRVDHITGTITTFAGTLGAYGFAGDGGQAALAKLFGPWQITFDASGNLYIADIGNARVRKVGLDGKISTFAGDGSTVADSFHGQPATSAHINGPTGVAADTLGNVFIASIPTTARVDAQGNIWSEGNQGALFLAIGPGNRLVATSACQAILIPSSLVAVVLAGSSNQSGCSGNSGDGAPARSAQFNTLYGVAADGTGNVFVADRFNKRVRRIQAYVAPGAPAAPGAVAGRNLANLQWTQPVDTGGLPIVNYTVKPYIGASPVANPTVVFNTPTTAQVTRLTTGTTYTFTVAADNGWAVGPESAHSAPVTLVLAAPGTITTFAGSVGSGPGSSIGQQPYAVTAGSGPTDAFNHVFISDLANPVVRDFNLNTNQEGALAGSDAYGFAGDGGSPLTALMQGATAIADCGGTVYFADEFNYVIREVNSTGKIFTVVGTGVPGYTGDGGPGTQAQISRVLGIACRSGGGIYFSDSDNRAVRILDQGGIISTWWGGFSFPTGLVELPFGNDDVAVADAGRDNAVLELTDTQRFLFAGTPGQAGNAGDGGLSFQALLSNPRSVAWTGNAQGFWLYIADTGNNRIRLVDSTTFNIINFEGNPNGQPGHSGSELNQPTSIAEFNSTLYIADFGNDRMRSVLTSGGAISDLAGNGTLSLSGDGGPAGSAQMGIPYAVALDAAGNQYIVDNLDNVIRKVDVTGTITSIGGSAGLTDPRGVAVDASGNAYVSDTGNQRVVKIDQNGNVTVMASGLNYPRGVAVNGAGHVFVTDTGNNRVLDVTNGVTVVAGTGAKGYLGDGGPAINALLNGPRGLAFDSQGSLYISDSDNNVVRKVAGGIITTVVGTGVAGEGGDGFAAKSATLNFPFGLGFDGAGNLYIADTGNQRLRVVDQGGIISTVVGICGGVAGFSGDGGLASTAQLNTPFGIAVDSIGDVYVADAANNRVRGGYALTGLRGAACQGVPGNASSRGAGAAQSPSRPPGPRVFDRGPASGLAAALQPQAGAPASAPTRGAVPAALNHPGAAPTASGAAPAGPRTPGMAPATPPPVPAIHLHLGMAAVDMPERPAIPIYASLVAAACALLALTLIGLRHRLRRRPARLGR